jgi:hypothetical protein
LLWHGRSHTLTNTGSRNQSDITRHTHAAQLIEKWDAISHQISPTQDNSKTSKENS